MTKPATNSSKKFGTFLGVYLPSLLTILGLVMYLRFGWVVGNVGLGLTIVIVLLASSITFITGLSASAIATNIQVGVGGEYFLISRSLGIETGGAIGIPLYFCRTLSVTFYCFGLAEVILLFWPETWGTMPAFVLQGLTGLLIILVTLMSGKSAALTLKAQVPIMILVVLSIIALFGGVFTHAVQAPLMEANYATAPGGFWYVFAVFFPAVTGVTAGISMSGDLRDPRESIPIGTIGAVLTGTVIYLLIPILFAISAGLTVDQLTDQQFGLKTWTELALWGSVLIIPAVCGALLSSAFGSILGGPRVLQALSMDGLAPKFLSKLSKSGQPTTATWISGLIALMAVGLGELNTIAQFVSVLFLTLYVTINLSAAVEDLVAEPSYRPQIRVPWYISVGGALGAIGAMFLISPLACFGAMGLITALYIWLRSRSFEQRWGDVTAGFWVNIARFAILKLKGRTIHDRNWRPLMLTFVRDVESRIQIVELAELLGQKRGILTVAHLRKAGKDWSLEKRKTIELSMAKKLAEHRLEAFCEVHRVDDLQRGIVEIAKGHGLADLRTNTVVFGWSDQLKGQMNVLKMIRQLSQAGKNIILARFKSEWPKEANQIDIWWGGQQNNGDLMLLLAYLLKLNPQWKKANIRILSLVDDEGAKERLTKGIEALLPKTGIRAAVEVVLSEVSFRATLRQKSSQSDLVFLGLPETQAGHEEQMAKTLEDLSYGLKVTVFVQNNNMSDSIPILLKV